MSEDVATIGEVFRSVVRIEASLKDLVTMSEYKIAQAAQDRRIHDLEVAAQWRSRLTITSLITAILAAIGALLRLKGM